MQKHLKSLILFMCVQSVIAQTKYLPMTGTTYDYLDYQINSGQVLPDWVLDQPYAFENKLFKSDDRASSYFAGYWQEYWSDKGLSGQLQFNDKIKFKEDIYNRYNVSGSLYWITPYVTFMNRTEVNQDFRYDPKFAGDLSESKDWIYGRVQDAYMDINIRGFNFFAGKTHRNWGPLNSASLILSDNPYSYDHFIFSYKTEKIKLSLIFARLENMTAKTIKSRDDSVNIVEDARKYIVGHRLNLSFSKNFQMAFSEFAIYGGADRDIEPAFFNPVNFYYPIQRNDQIPISGIWAVDLFYKPVPEITLYSQFLIDDIIVNNDPGVDDRSRFDDRLGLMMSVRSGDLLFKGLNTDLTYVRIWNRTYQSKSTWENWHYRELGLGYPVASGEELKLNLAYWDLFPFFIKNEFIWGRYGNVNLTDIFPLKKEKFPLKPVTENFVNILNIRYFHSIRINAGLTFRYFDKASHFLNRIDNQGHGWSFMLDVSYVLAGGIWGN